MYSCLSCIMTVDPLSAFLMISVLTWTCVKDGACRCKGVYTSPERGDLLTLFTFLQQPNCCCLMYIHIFDILEAVQSASSSFFETGI